jgi:type IV pilus assembly protein PilE
MKKQTGFTLIELMIVVAVIGLIAMVAIPSYNSQTQKARRSDAQQLMLDIANKQQQYLMDARQYTTSPATLSITKDGWTCSAANCTNSFYTVTVVANNAATPPTYTITATATGNQVSDGNMTLNNLGAKTLAGNTGW